MDISDAARLSDLFEGTDTEHDARLQAVINHMLEEWRDWLEMDADPVTVIAHLFRGWSYETAPSVIVGILSNPCG